MDADSDEEDKKPKEEINLLDFGPSTVEESKPVDLLNSMGGPSLLDLGGGSATTENKPVDLFNLGGTTAP